MLKNNGNTISETAYTRLKTRKPKYYTGTGIYREQTSYYDKHHKKIRFTDTEPVDKNAKPTVVELNGKKYTFTPKAEDQNWDYRFENTYDKAGNLVTQKRSIGDKLQDETTFVYDDKGLLKEQRQSNHNEVTKFEYTYY